MQFSLHAGKYPLIANSVIYGRYSAKALSQAREDHSSVNWDIIHQGRCQIQCMPLAAIPIRHSVHRSPFTNSGPLAAIPVRHSVLRSHHLQGGKGLDWKQYATNVCIYKPIKKPSVLSHKPSLSPATSHQNLRDITCSFLEDQFSFIIIIMNDDMGWEPINCLEEEDDLVYLWYNAFQRPEDPAFLNFPESS
jgi:hypothetical protein